MSYHHDDTGLYDVISINKSVQGSSGSMSTMKRGKLQTKVCQVNQSGKSHKLWPVKYCAKAGANQFSLTCKLSQGSIISSDCKNKIVAQSTVEVSS